MGITEFRADESYARSLDAADPLRTFRDRFHFPRQPDGSPVHYFCGHSLGLQPKGVRAAVDGMLDDWSRFGVEGHFQGDHPWYDYHEQFREAGARLIGGKPGEVVMMNSLTVNLHLMLLSFYRPTPERFKILIDGPTFPSDLYAVQSQLGLQGQRAEDALLMLSPRAGALDLAEVEASLDEHGAEIALVLFNGVNFATGQWYDLARLARAGHKHGCIVGLDLAHAAGNVPLQLHDWQVDFAVWCSYKYLNSGPGAVAGCFVHEKHGQNTSLPRCAGWWGNDPKTRFSMPDRFVPRAGADGWQLSNPPILAMAPLLVSLALFEEAGFERLRAKSMKLTAYFEKLLESKLAGRVEMLTPRAPEQRGCQLSLRVPGRGRDLVDALQERGVVCDFRPPDVIRAAPVPLYNSFLDVYRFVELLERFVK